MLDVIIVNYKSTFQVLNCLKSIFDSNNSIKFKVFVFDNGSDDDVDIISGRYPQVRLEKSLQNLGFAKAVNTLLALGNAPYVMLLNPDTIVGKQLFGQTIQYMELHPDVAILGPKILNPDGTLQGSARKNPDFLTGFFGRSSVLTRWFPNNRISRKNVLDFEAKNQPFNVDWVSGACMLVRRKAVCQVGGLDERFFMYWEDADWCRQMRENGWEIVYYPLACLMHVQGVSSQKNRLRSTVEFHKSVFKLMNKYHENLCMILGPLILCLLGVRLILKVLTDGLKSSDREK